MCPRCKGKGKISVKVSTCGPDGATPESSFEMTCFDCKGSGEMTAAGVRAKKAADALWCRCGNESGETKFFDDGEHPNCSKHCYVCLDCGKITQVG